jgi:hypothetical protein
MDAGHGRCGWACQAAAPAAGAELDLLIFSWLVFDTGLCQTALNRRLSFYTFVLSETKSFI